MTNWIDSGLPTTQVIDSIGMIIFLQTIFI